MRSETLSGCSRFRQETTGSAAPTSRLQHMHPHPLMRAQKGALGKGLLPIVSIICAGLGNSRKRQKVGTRRSRLTVWKEAEGRDRGCSPFLPSSGLDFLD